MSFSIHFSRMPLFVAVIIATAAFLPSAASAAVVPARLSGSNYGMEDRVREYFADIPVMIEIARCESQFIQYGKSGRPLHGGTGTMIGLFQISEVLHRDVADNFGWDIDTPEGNMSYARYLYEQHGTAPWLDSKSCWNAPASAARWKVATQAASREVVATSTEQLGGGGEGSSTSIIDIRDKFLVLLAKLSVYQAGLSVQTGQELASAGV
ncbi:hypothetical protein HZC00_02795 [Candidatus Kaiserbacteria bacterium]|nr:hypothetical protein [Candidatus Kaiserbacteria bacterium]